MTTGRSWTRLWLIAAAAALLTGCGAARNHPRGAGAMADPPRVSPAAGAACRHIAGYDATGDASWYDRRYHGRKTASGRIFDMNEMTATHRRLPFGSRVSVTNLRNARTVEV